MSDVSVHARNYSNTATKTTANETSTERVTNYNANINNRTPSNDLGKDAFLKILMVQLQNQDPMNPMEDKDFIAQMAQFTTLEQMTNMNTLMKQSLAMQENNNIFVYSQMIGKEVGYVVIEKDENGDEVVVEKSATVKSVSYKGNDIVCEMSNGETISVAQIFKVGNEETKVENKPETDNESSDNTSK